MSRPAEFVAPRGIISRLPLGILGFLGIKNGGEYPRHLANVLAPTWDMLELLHGSQNEELHGAAIAAGAAGTVTSLGATIGQGEVWFVRFLSVRAVTAVGEALSGSVAVRKPQAGTSIIPLSNQITLAATQTSYQLMTTGAAFFGPGSEFVWWTNSLTGAPTVRLAMQFNRLPM